MVASIRTIYKFARTGLALLVLGYLCGLSPALLPAQQRTLRFDRLTIEDGLPNPTVMDILQDDLGFIWIATLSGIARYDGREMVTYYPTAVPPDSLPAREFPRLFKTKSGDIWLGLSYQKARLFRYVPEQDRFVPYLYDTTRTPPIIEGLIFGMAEDRQGNLVVAADGQGVFVIETSREKEGIDPAHLPYRLYEATPEHPDSLPTHYFGNTLLTDDQGHIWLPTDEGLCRFLPEEGRFETYLSAQSCATVFSDEPDRLWVGTWRDGLIEFDTQNKKIIRQFRHDPEDSFGLANDNVSQIAPDWDGKLWITAGLYLQILDPKSGKFQSVKSSEASGTFHFESSINAVFRDFSDNTWIGVWQEGVLRYNPDKDKFHLLRSELSKDKDPEDLFIYPLLEDQEGNLWVGSEGKGMVRWNPKDQSLAYFEKGENSKTGLVDKTVFSMVEGQGRFLWMGNRTALSRYDPSTGTFLHLYEYPHADLWKSRDGTIWMNVWGKAFCRILDEEKGTTLCYQKAQTAGREGLGSVTSFAEDENGQLWLGTNHSGLIRFAPKSETFETVLRRYGVRDIHFSAPDTAWLSTHSAGLKGFDTERGSPFSLPPEEAGKTGLTQSTLEDDHGRLWIYSDKGLVLFDPLSKRVIRVFKRSFWQPARAEWYSGNTAAAKGRSGELFFGSSTGILYFHPDSIRVDSVPPKLALTALRLGDRLLQPGPDSPLHRHIAYTREIELRHFQNDLTLTFTALHFKSPADNLYRYQLEGYDQGWRENGQRNTTVYTNLPPGRYTFRLQAANSDNIWSKPADLLHIRIRPPWYANPVAYGIYGVLLAALLWFLYQNQLRRRLAKAEIDRQREVNRFKSRFYANITHEFRTPLTLILGTAEDLAGQSTEGIRKSQQLIRRQGRQLLRLVDQVLELSKLESRSLDLELVLDDIVPFIKGVAAGFDSAARQKGIQLSVHTAVESLEMDFDPERMQMVLSNLLSNAVKFTPREGKIQLYILVEKSRKGDPNATGEVLLLTVQNTGAGIPPEALPFIFDRFYQVGPSKEEEEANAGGTGIGLALVKELVDRMEGRVTLDSAPGKGATFRIELPIRRTASPGRSSVAIEDTVLESEETAIDNAYRTGPLYPSPAHIDPPLLLIVEDHPEMVTFLSSILEKRFRIRTAPDGKKGLERARKEVPDIILSDVMMPELDGLAFCRKLKEDVRTSHIPIILLTAKAGQEHRVEGLSLGADAYLTKPFDRKELLVRMKQLLEVRQTLRRRYENLSSMDLSGAEPFQREDAFMQEVQKAILDHLDESGFQVPELCRALGLSRTQLHHKLKALTGRSAGRYLKAVRLHEARKLLVNTSLNITEIAYRVGFQDPNYFSTAFREVYGRSPSSLRKNS